MSRSAERRKRKEFERMLAIRRPNGLIDFKCGDLTEQEATAFLGYAMEASVIREHLPGFLTVEQYQTRFPDRAPDKYLVEFRCRGLVRPRGIETVVETDRHALQIVLGLDFPVKPPRFVWLTPIWHPNILPPYLCTADRPFALGMTLDQLCLMAGAMIQYRSYNLASVMNEEAKTWTLRNMARLPVDRRDLLDGEIHDRAPLVELDPDRVTGSPPSVELLPDGGTEFQPLVELDPEEGPPAS